MLTIHLVLLVLALVAFIMATFNYPAKINLTALGLTLLTLAWLISR